MKGLKVGIIGCGNMGGAIARGIAEKGITGAGSVLLYDKDASKAEALAEKTAFTHAELSRTVENSDILILAVKPQDFAGLSGEISGHVDSQTVVSVMAGVKIAAIEEGLGKELPVARTMPNLAALIGEGVTCISFNEAVTLTGEIKEIFSGVGKVLEIDEKFMDVVTAVSGNGPAYLFYLAEAMISAGREMGLDEGTARELVEQTLYGAARLMREEKSSPGELITKVASKGGATEAALSVFGEKGLNSIVKAAILRGKQRAEELSKG